MDNAISQPEVNCGLYQSMEDFLKLQEEMNAIKRALTKQSKDLEEIKKCHQTELKYRDTTIVKLNTRINILENNAAVSNLKMEHREIRVDDNEQYSRRHSLRLSGIEKKKYNETADDVMQVIYEEMDRLDTPIEEVEIDRAHRSGKKYKDQKGKWQQPVLLKFNSWKARNTMYKLRKHSKFYIKADLTSRKERVLSYAIEQIEQADSIADKFIKYVYADANCALVAFTSTGRFLRFNSEYEFDLLAHQVDSLSSMSEKVYDTIARQMEYTHPGE